jgi:hypothetical protein
MLETSERPTPKEAENLGYAVYEEHPDIVQKLLWAIKRPQPLLTHLSYIYPLRQQFCERQGIEVSEFVGTSKGHTIKNFQRTFIASIIYIYNPEILTGYSSVIITGLAEELSEMVGIDRSAISQEVADIKKVFKPAKDENKNPFVIKALKEKQIAILSVSETIVQPYIKKDVPAPPRLIDMFETKATG